MSSETAPSNEQPSTNQTPERKEPNYKLEPEYFNKFREFMHTFVSKHVLRFWLKRKGLRPRIVGTEHIPPLGSGSFLVAANHTETADLPLISHALDFRPIAYVGKKELFYRPLARLYFEGVAVIPIDREKPSISTFRSIKNAFQNPNWCVGIFPEGTRNNDGTIREAKGGVSLIAQKNKVPILPITVSRYGADNLDAILHIGPMIPYQPELSNDALASLVTRTLRELKNTSDDMAMNSGLLH